MCVLSQKPNHEIYTRGVSVKIWFDVIEKKIFETEIKYKKSVIRGKEKVIQIAYSYVQTQWGYKYKNRVHIIIYIFFFSYYYGKRNVERGINFVKDFFWNVVQVIFLQSTCGGIMLYDLHYVQYNTILMRMWSMRIILWLNQREFFNKKILSK